MSRKIVSVCGAGAAVLLALPGLADAEQTKAAKCNPAGPHCEHKPAAHSFLPWADGRGEDGIEMGFNVTNIYQADVMGAAGTHRRAGRFSGSYVLELLADTNKMFAVEGGGFYVVAEGSWSDGIDEPSVGSFFGVNGDAAGNRSIDVTEFWYEQLLSDAIRIRLGKIDLTGGCKEIDNLVLFDSSAYANYECTQFLNNALINNPTVPFPDNGLAVAVLYNPSSLWYAEAAVADAQADARETGFRTTFAGEDYFFYIFETAITPQFVSANGRLPGAYRAGLWYDPQPKANTNYANAGRTSRDDVGFYVSCDQMLAKENDRPDDEQGPGVFFRYGNANGRRNNITDFFSAGFQYTGLIEGRDGDVLGFGFAHGTFSDSASSTYTDDYEAVFEIYYSAEIAPWFIVSPSIQYVRNPGGDRAVDDAVILGARVFMTF